MHQDARILAQSAVVVATGLVGGWHELANLACHHVALKHSIVVDGMRTAGVCVVSPWWPVHVGGVAVGTMVVAFCTIVLLENLPWTWREAARAAVRAACRATVQLSRRRFAETWQRWCDGRNWTVWAETKAPAPILLLSAPVAKSELPDEDVEAMPAAVSLDHPVIAGMSDTALGEMLGVHRTTVHHWRYPRQGRKGMPAAHVARLRAIVDARGSGSGGVAAEKPFCHSAVPSRTEEK